MSDKQTNIPTVEETNSLLSAPVRPAGYEEPEQEEVQDQPVESNGDTLDGDSVDGVSGTQTALACESCDFIAKSANGLKSHQRTHNTK